MAKVDEDGWITTCDRCGARSEYKDFSKDRYTCDIRLVSGAEQAHQITNYWTHDIFKGKHKPRELYADFCKECAIATTPHVWRLREICEVDSENNKLMRAINDRRKGN